MKIGIHGKKYSEAESVVIYDVFKRLCDQNAEIFVSAKFHKFLKKNILTEFKFEIFNPEDDLSILDMFFSVGGDGTLLETVTYIGPSEVPVLGINTGRLGFLATIAKNEISGAIKAIFDKKFIIEERSLLHLDSNKDLFNGVRFALNDFTILKKDTTSMIVVHAYINGEFLNSYWADGIIVSTPTGSTGYSLSCGGPLILPQSNNFVITPVSPHNLTARPMVVADDCELRFEIEGRSKTFLVSLDSRFDTVDESVMLSIKKEAFKVKLVNMPEHSHFNTLRQKLNWGWDIRN